MSTAHCACPHCGNTLASTPIPVDSMGCYGGTDGEPMDCPYGCGQPRHYSRLIGLYDTGRDRTAAWQCPDCGVRWAR